MDFRSWKQNNPEFSLKNLDAVKTIEGITGEFLYYFTKGRCWEPCKLKDNTQIAEIRSYYEVLFFLVCLLCNGYCNHKGDSILNHFVVFECYFTWLFPIQ